MLKESLSSFSEFAQSLRFAGALEFAAALEFA
jgi:hypothetical protein